MSGRLKDLPIPVVRCREAMVFSGRKIHTRAGILEEGIVTGVEIKSGGIDSVAHVGVVDDGGSGNPGDQSGNRRVNRKNRSWPPLRLVFSSVSKLADTTCPGLTPAGQVIVVRCCKT